VASFKRTEMRSSIVDVDMPEGRDTPECGQPFGKGRFAVGVQYPIMVALGRTA
jgi:hypothetical protein